MTKVVPIKERYFIIEYTPDSRQSNWFEHSSKKYLSLTQAQEQAKQHAQVHLGNIDKQVYGFRVVETNIETTLEVITEFLI